MSVFATLAKWKLRWAALTGFFTLIVLPLLRFVFKRRTAGKKSSEVIDVQAEEIKK
jgi:hypothetical protein